MTIKMPADHGRWDGSTFYFEPPLRVPSTTRLVMEVTSVDTSHIVGVFTAEQMVFAMLNPGLQPEWLRDVSEQSASGPHNGDPRHDE